MKDLLKQDANLLVEYGDDLPEAEVFHLALPQGSFSEATMFDLTP